MPNISHRVLTQILLLCATDIVINPTYALSGSEPQLENLGDALIIRNPDLLKPRPVQGSSRITSEQLVKAVPITLPKPQTKGVSPTISIVPTEGVKPNMKLVLPAMPKVAANIPAPLNQFTSSYSTPSIAAPLAVAPMAATASNPCGQPNGFGPMLDCYYHPYTDTPGSYFPTYSTSYPWSAIGILLFHEPDQSTDDFYHSCTATVISGPPNNLVVTAAHCIIDSDTGQSYKDFTFIPGSSNGSQPFGQFPYKFAMVLPTWLSSKYASRYDVALVSLQDNASGHPVSELTGSLGMMVNGSYIQNVSAVGYSISEVPIGKWSTVSNSQTYQFVPKQAKKCKAAKLDGTDLLIMGSGLSNGASGGPLINSFYPFLNNGFGNNLVTGTVHGNFGCSEMTKNLLANVRFTDGNIGLLCQSIAGGCGQEINYKTVTLKAVGRGAVVSAPNGILCGRGIDTPYRECTASFTEGSTITFTAIPDRGGYTFGSWDGACIGNSETCELEITEDLSVTATFNDPLTQWQLKVPR